MLKMTLLNREIFKNPSGFDKCSLVLCSEEMWGWVRGECFVNCINGVIQFLWCDWAKCFRIWKLSTTGYDIIRPDGIDWRIFQDGFHIGWLHRHTHQGYVSHSWAIKGCWKKPLPVPKARAGSSRSYDKSISTLSISISTSPWKDHHQKLTPNCWTMLIQIPNLCHSIWMISQ